MDDLDVGIDDAIIFFHPFETTLDRFKGRSNNRNFVEIHLSESAFVCYFCNPQLPGFKSHNASGNGITGHRISGRED